jgi:hypothetical protein
LHYAIVLALDFQNLTNKDVLLRRCSYAISGIISPYFLPETFEKYASPSFRA